jgi:RNase H-fold protein (predicted Holliday junction resolvase)
MTYESKIDSEKMAALASSMTQMHVEALHELSQYGLTLQDIAFASVIALKAVSQMQGEDGLDKLHEAVDAAFAQQVLGKRFDNEEEAQEWMQKEGIIPPPGPTH